MPSLTEKRNAAGDRYATAVQEFLASRTDLAALDRLCAAQGFGIPLDMILLRHSTFAPALSGSVTDDIPAAIAAHAQYCFCHGQHPVFL
jgi:hypothetical protein